jgi:YidC/Oxa1 family membrane protein insertase
MEKRILLAIFLSFAVLYVYSAVFVPSTPPPNPAASKPGTRPPAGAAAEGRSGTPPAPAPGVQTAPEAPAAPPVATVLGEPAERQIVMDNGVLRVIFTNRGAEVASWQLTRFKNGGQADVDLVPRDLPARLARPFALDVDDDAVDERLRTAVFRVTGDRDGKVTTEDGPATLVFEYQDAAGVTARKELRFERNSYLVRYTIAVSRGGRALNPTVMWGPGLGDASSASRYLQKTQGILYRSGKVERLVPKTLASQPVQEAQFRYAGIDDQYFISAVLPQPSARAVYQPVTLPVPGQAQETRDLVSYGVRVAGGSSNVRLFAGPKDFDVLKSVDGEFVKTINFGVFAFLAVPLLRALNWINGYVGNYGWSIILLTFLINVAMFPLRHKSVVSMRKLQELAPEIKAIQARYSKLKATDPARQKMNTETMSLYRERGVNPASGCVPMLLTIPVLFAFYSLLSQAIEIRGAPFAAWITDLSQHDPYYVTPLLMGATMVWQQKITPSSVDPAQQKMMMFMPIIFTVMFLWAPSGLVLYWLVSNALAIAQQYATNTMIGPPAVRAVRPPAERRLKSAGSGKSEGPKG